MRMQFKEYLRFTKISAFFAFSTALLSPVLSPYLKGMGFSDFQLGLVFSLLPLSIILFCPFIGKLSDMTSRRIVIEMGIVLEVLAVVIYIFGNSLLLVGFARVLDALAAISVSLISLAGVQDVIGSRKRGEYTGWTETFNYLGGLTAPVIGALLADIFFIQAPFLLSMVLLSVLFFSLFRASPLPKIDGRKLNPLGEIGKFLSNRQLRGMAIAGIVMHASTPAINLFLPLFIIYELGLNISYVGYALFFLGFMHIFQFWFGKIADRHGSWKIVLLGCVISALGMTFMSFSTSFAMLILFLFIRGTGNAMWNVSAWSLMSDIGERSRREGSVITSYLSIATIGAFVSFLLSGLVVTFYSIQTLFLLDSIVVLAGAAVSYRFLKKKV